MLKLGDLELGTRPQIVAIIDDFISCDEILKIKERGIGLLEMRVDCLDAELEKIVPYIQMVRNTVSLPMIGTVRETDRTRASRIDYFKAILPFVDCVDIELGTPISDSIIANCKQQLIMVSEHDFNGTPSDDGLQTIVNKALDQGAHIVKIAVMANNKDDVRRLLRFTDNCQTPVVTIAMGALGTITRLIAPVFGSLFTYGYITKAVAPGQLSVAKLQEEFKIYYPQF